MLSAATRIEPSAIGKFFILVCMGMPFVLFISNFLYLCAKSKWREYAVRYPCPNKPAGDAWAVRWASFGIRGNQGKYTFEKYVRVHFSENGVYLSMGRIMGHICKPFLLPWNKVKIIEQYDGPFYRKYMVSIWEGPDEIYLEMFDKGQGNLLKQFYKNPLLSVIREWSWLQNSDLIDCCGTNGNLIHMLKAAGRQVED